MKTLYKSYPVFSLCVVMFFVALLAFSCSPPQLELNFSYPGGTKKPALTTMKISLQGTGLSWKHEIDVKQKKQSGEPFSLDPFDCEEAKKQALRAGLSLNNTLGLPLEPFLLFEGFEGNELVISGRFSLESACQRQQASVLLIPPNRTVGFLSDPQLGRIGHQVTRLPDGRYLITGGLRAFAPPSSGAWPGKIDEKDFVKETAIYDPSSGKVTKGPVLQNPRAFHTATLAENKVFLLGGLAPKGQLAFNEELTIDSEQKFAEQTKLGKFQGPAFHKIQQLYSSDGKSGLVSPFGGMFCYGDKPPTNCEKSGEQLLFHTTTYIPGKPGRIVILGGLSYKPKQKLYGLYPFGVVFEVTESGNKISLSKPKQFALKDLGKGEGALLWRAGHSATLVDGKHILIYGGYLVTGGHSNPFKAFDYVNTPVLLNISAKEPKDWDVHPVSMRYAYTPAPRFLHTATKLHDSTSDSKGTGGDQRILISGGFRSFEEDDAVHKGALLLVRRKETAVYHFDAYPMEVPAARAWHRATLLDTGSVWLSGGVTKTKSREWRVVDSASLFNPEHKESGMESPCKDNLQEVGCEFSSVVEAQDGQITITAITSNESGELFIAGHFSGNVKLGENSFTWPKSLGSPRRHSDGFVAKMLPTGEFTWVKRIGFSTQKEEIHSIKADDQDHVFLVGGFNGRAFFTSSELQHRRYSKSSSGSDVFVLNLSQEDGALTWLQTAGGTGNDMAYSVAVAPDKAVYVGGFFTADATFGSVQAKRLTHQAKGETDSFIARISSKGQWEWVVYSNSNSKGIKRGPSSSELRSLAVDSSGSVYYTGNFRGFLRHSDNTIRSNGKQDFFIGKIEVKGGKAPAQITGWSHAGGSTDDDESTAIVLGDKGLIFAIGSFSKKLTIKGKTLESKAKRSGVLMAFSQSDGKLSWLKGFFHKSKNFRDNIIPTHMALDGDKENLFLAGFFQGESNFNAEDFLKAEKEDVFVLKVSVKDGKTVWAKRAGGPEDDSLAGLALTPFGLTLSGSFQGDMDFPEKDLRLEFTPKDNKKIAGYYWMIPQP